MDKNGGAVAPEVETYLRTAPAEGVQAYERVRALVLSHAEVGPVTERLSYRMPTFFVGGRRLLHVGLWAEHLAIYPIPLSTTDTTLSDDLTPFVKGKGTLHLRYRDEWPAALVERVVAAHVARLRR